jgi:5-methylcytosine-specific restriction endonuclease McrA
MADIQLATRKKGPPFGRVPWNKGRHVATRPKTLYLSHRCRQCGKEFWAYPSEQRTYCSQSCRSKYCFAPERNPWRGKTLTPTHRANLSAAHVGRQAKEKHPLWRGGRYKTERKADMASLSYKRWRLAVFERDNYRCVECGATGYLHADHIQPYAKYPDLRHDVTNGRTLCVNCHRRTPTYAGRTNNV